MVNFNSKKVVKELNLTMYKKRQHIMIKWSLPQECKIGLSLKGSINAAQHTNKPKKEENI